MGTATKNIVDFKNGAVSVELDYDIDTLYVTNIRVINKSENSVFVSARMISGSKTYERSFLPGATSIEVSTKINERLELNLTSEGKLDGVSVSAICPYL